MKKIRKLFITGLFVLGIGLISAALPSQAAFGARSIQIQDAPKSMTVGSKTDLDSKITPRKARVRDRNIIWSSSDSKVIKVLDRRDDDTKIKALKTGKAVITVKIKGTDIKASKTIRVKKVSAAANSGTKGKIRSYETDLKNIDQEIKNLMPATAYTDRRTQYYGLKEKIENIEDALDRLEDQIEDDYYDGKINRENYRTLDRLVEDAEDYADQVDDHLDAKFQFEFDD